MSNFTSDQLSALLAGCRRGERSMQQRLYGLYYSYALGICLRYTRQRDEAEEVVNDGFLKAFRDIGRFDTERYELVSSFRGWLKKIMIRTAIDYFRAHEKHHAPDSLDDMLHEPADQSHTPLDSLAYDELLHLVQQLPPAYRAVFNLFAIDGYTHEEIAQQLGITTGTSKSNLSKARVHLQHLLKKLISMPTPLMPDEEFDALFRQGLEPSPEQPHSPAAWHCMELLLEANLRQQALRRKLWRLLGAEAVLLLGIWSLFSARLGQLPAADATQPTLTKTASSLPSPQTSLTNGQLRARGETAPTGMPPASQPRPASAAILTPRATKGLSQATHASATSLAPVGTSTQAQPTAGTTATIGKMNLSASALAGRKKPRSRHAQAVQSVAEHQASLGAYAQPKSSVGPCHLLTSGAVGTSNTQAERAGGSYSESSKAAEASRAAHRRQRANQRLAFYPGYPGQQSHHQLPSAAMARGARGAVVVTSNVKKQRSLVVAHKERLPAAAEALPALRQAQAVTKRTAAGSLTTPASWLDYQPMDALAVRQATVTSQLSPPVLALPGALVGLPMPARPTDSLPSLPPLLSAYRVRLGVVAAPEFSTVRASELTTPGSNLGVQLDYQLARRWRLSTGYFYTNKIYVARGSDYNLPAGYVIPNHWVISNVDAVCRIVDIPLNLRYDVWQQPRYQVFASAGLSSLLMRREQYTYEYEPANGQPVPDYTWDLRNGSQHSLSILNLSVGYERALGSRWSLQAEPFVKLPLVGVGFGTVRLSSAGVFFSLKYGLWPVRPAPARP